MSVIEDNVLGDIMFSKNSFKLLLASAAFLCFGSTYGHSMDEREPIYLIIPPKSAPFKLPDGSKVAVSNSDVWVQTPTATHYSTTWQTYAQQKKLRIQAVVLDTPSKTPTLRIKRGSAPFTLPDGAEVAINGSDEIWVKKQTQAYYATPWETYQGECHLAISSVIVSRPKALVELKITRASSLFKFTLPDGSEVHVNNGNRVWVKTPSDSYPSTRWEDYIHKNKVSMWPSVTTGLEDSAVIHISRGSIPVALPGGFEVAVNSSDEIWVKKPSQAYYATPWNTFAQETSLTIKPVLDNETRTLPVPFEKSGIHKEGYMGIVKTNLEVCKRGYETFSGNVVTVEMLGVKKLQDKSQKFKHSALDGATSKNYNTVFKVTDEDSYVAALKMKQAGLNPSVSNAANADKPGGGFIDGAQAQEEEICKRSTLYQGLRQELYPMQDDELIYSSPVTVFLNPNTYTFMDQPVEVSVITQAYIPLYARFLESEEPEKTPEYQKVTKEKIRAHLRLAAKMNHDSVVLAASGCGGFSRGRQGPVSKVVATLYRQVLDEEFQGVFKEVRFAILKGGLISAAFKEAFGLTD